MERRSSMRLRHRSNDLVVVNGDGDSDSEDLPSPPKKRVTIKTVIVREYDVLKSRVLLKEPELMLECEDDPLTTVQLRSNHMAKEAHALSMRQIQAAHENRLTFDREGKPVIHDCPVNVQKATVTPFTSNGGIGLSNPARPLQQSVPINKIQSMYRPLLAHNAATTTSVNNQRYIISNPSPQSSIPVQRVAAQPREIISGTAGLGVDLRGNVVSMQNQLIQKRQQNENEYVTLDEYYYGKKEGNPNYLEEKGEFRFKCWYCNKMLYNNVKAMMHLQSHIDSEKQQNLDLRDLTQCKHCYKQFDTPFEMQTHIEKVHLTNSNILMCRICEKDHDSKSSLTSHMKGTHTRCEMPYICQICEFRSSMYGDVVDHFKKKHDSSPNLLCLYCLRVFKIKFVNNGWGSTQNFYHHLCKHQTKSRSKKCHSCKLAFLNPQDMKSHQKKDHLPNRRVTGTTIVRQEQRAAAQPCGNSSARSVKSLNAPAVMKNLDLSRLHIPRFVENYYCYECKQSISSHDHFKNHKECSMCRFATSCSAAYANHMLSFHSGRSAFLTITKEHLLPGRRYCLCGFSSRYGNKIANHMVFCFKRTCYSQKTESEFPTQEVKSIDPAPRTGSSILDVLGLMKKQTAKRSSDESPATSQYESETFVGITTLGMAHRDAAANDAALESDGDSDADYHMEDEVESDNDDNDDNDDDDDDYKPGGRFRKPPSSGHGTSRRSSGAMLVKMNFGRNKTKTESSPHKTFGITQPLHMSRDSTLSANQSKSTVPKVVEDLLSRDESLKSENISRKKSTEEKIETQKLKENSEESSKSLTDTHVADSSAAKLESDISDSKPEVSLTTDSSAIKADEESEASQNSGTSETKSIKSFEESDNLAKGEHSAESKDIEKSTEMFHDLEMETSNKGDNASITKDACEKVAPGCEVTEEISKDTDDNVEISKTSEAMDTSETTTTPPVTKDTSDSIETTDQSVEMSENFQEQKTTDKSEKIDAIMADKAQNVSENTANSVSTGQDLENISQEVSKDFYTEDNEEEMETSASVSQREETNSQKEPIPEKEEPIPETEEPIPETEDPLPETAESLPETKKESTQADKVNTDDDQSKSENPNKEEDGSSALSNKALDEKKTVTKENLPKSEEDSTSKNSESDTLNEIKEIKDSNENAERDECSPELKKDDDSTNMDACNTSEKGVKSNEAKSLEASPQKEADAEAKFSPSLSQQESSDRDYQSSNISEQISGSEPSPKRSKDRQSSEHSPTKEYRSDEHRSEERDRKSSHGDEFRDSRSHDDRRDSHGSHHSKSGGHDKSDRRHSGSGHSRSHDYDRHSNRYERDDKYRDRSSGRYDDRSGRGYERGNSDHYDDRGHSSRDYGSHGNRDRDRDRDNRNYDKNRKDRDSQGSQSNRHGRDGYHSSQRRDYN